MAFQISPGVNVSEIDLTDSIPQTATTAGGLVGIFSWGPLGLPNSVTTVSTTTELKNTFGRPTDDNFKSFFTAKNYLSYSSDLKISRLYNELTTTNAVDSTSTTDTEVMHKFISFSNTLGTGVTDVANNYVNDGVSYSPSSWSGDSDQSFKFSPYSMGSFYEGTTYNIGVEYDGSGEVLTSNGTTLSENNVLLGVPTDWTGNFTHNLGTPSVFQPLNDSVTVKLKTEKDYVGSGTYLSNDPNNPWTIDVLNDNVRLNFAEFPNLRKNPVGDVSSVVTVGSMWTDTVSGILDEPTDLGTIVFGPSFGLGVVGATTNATITVTSSDATPAILSVDVTIDDSSGVSAIVVTSMTHGANLDLSALTYDYTDITTADAFTAVTGIEVAVPQRNTFNLPSGLRFVGGNIKLYSGGSELSSVSQYGILPDSTTNEFIYITDTLYDLGVLREFILESIGPLFNIRSATGVLIKDQSFVDTYTGDSFFAARYPGEHGNNIKIYLIDIDTIASSKWNNNVDMFFDDSNDLAVVITERETLLSEDIPTEIYVNLTKGSGVNNWISTINNQSSLVWILGVPLDYRESLNLKNVWNSSVIGEVRTYYNLLSNVNHEYILSDGNDGDIDMGDWTDVDRGLSPFLNKDVSDISLLFGAGDNLSKIDYIEFVKKLVNIAHSRRDVVAVISPHESVVGHSLFNSETGDFDIDKGVGPIIDFFDDVRAEGGSDMHSYAFADSNFKYQYDVDSSLFRWVPLCGDIAGVMSRTDENRDPWFSPAGFNRGGIKNVTKLRMSQDKTDRDMLYKASINPVCTFPGQGTILYGDKTLTRKSTSFDRINVRRLFIVLEELIEAASTQSLFEFNDDFTRNQFVSMVEPFLRDVKGRRGLYDFKVVCDSTNNTPTVIDSNRFIGDIYIKPSRSINFIQLNFVAVATGVEFNEVVGNF
jgi:hypothetical protein